MRQGFRDHRPPRSLILWRRCAGASLPSNHSTISTLFRPGIDRTIARAHLKVCPMKNRSKPVAPDATTHDPEMHDIAPDRYEIPLYNHFALSLRSSGFHIENAGTMRTPDGQDTGLAWVNFRPGQEPEEPEDEGMRRRQAWHQKMLSHSAGPMRSLVKPTEAMIARVGQIKSRAPHFASVIDWILRAMRLAIMTRTPLSLPPCLLVGPPGIGKTWFLRQLSESLGVPSLFLAMNVMADRGSTLTGLSPTWKSSGPGKIAKILIDGASASPLVILDEIDKISPINPAETPVECLHSLLEPENARTFVDEFIDVEIDASHLIWFASANDPNRLPPSIRDRFMTFTIEINESQRRHIARGIFATANAGFKDRFSLGNPGLIEAMMEFSPRQAMRIWQLAFGFAAEAKRDIVTARDVHQAAALLEERARDIGFIPNRQHTH